MLSPRSLESRLLLTCIRPDVQPDTIRSLLRGQPNWQAILEQATSLGVETLVYAGLKLVSESGQPPEEIVEQLGHAYRRNAARNLVLMDDLGRVLTALSEMGIPVIVLKGAALAELVYSGVGLRKMVDLDLLVQRPDLDTAESLLQRLGYRAMGSHSEWDRHHHHIIPYMSPTGSSVVEIHHHIHRQTPLLAVSVRDLWSRAGHARIASVPTQVLAPADLILHSCLHLAHDNTFLGQVRGLRDIAETICRCGRDVDWHQLVASGGEYRAQTYLYYPLWAARELLGADVPPGVITELESSVQPGSIEGRLIKLIIPRAVLLDWPRSYFVRFCITQACAEFLSSKRPSQKVRTFVERVFSQFLASARYHLLTGR